MGPALPVRLRNAVQQPLRLGASIAVAVGCIFGAATASAQTLTLSENVTRQNPRPSTRQPTWISLTDCERGEPITFNLTLTGNFTQLALEVWATSDSDCALDSERRGADAGCWQVQEAEQLSDDTPQITISARQLLSSVTGSPAGLLAEDEECAAYDASSAQPLNVFFLLRQPASSTDVPAERVGTWPTFFDLRGPPAPTEVSGGVGEDSIVLDWTATSGGDNVGGYRLFCEAIASETPCSASQLAEAMVPSSELEPCGEETGPLTNNGTASDLMNGTSYAVGVAAFDEVGNVGPLSSLVCATPAETDSFYEVYRRAGGQGGGGFCSFGLPRSPGGVHAALAALGLVVLMRRRRR
jgi:hypothetical protein